MSVARAVKQMEHEAEVRMVKVAVLFMETSTRCRLLEASEQLTAVNHELVIESEITALLRAEPVADIAAPSQLRSQVDALRRVDVGKQKTSRLRNTELRPGRRRHARVISNTWIVSFKSDAEADRQETRDELNQELKCAEALPSCLAPPSRRLDTDETALCNVATESSSRESFTCCISGSKRIVSGTLKREEQTS